MRGAKVFRSADSKRLNFICTFPASLNPMVQSADGARTWSPVNSRPPFRLHCFGRLGRSILNRADVPVAGLRQWTTVEISFIEFAQVDRLAA